MSKKYKKIILIIVAILLIGVAIITYYSLSNNAWYAKGGNVSWITYDEARILFGDEALFLSKDYIERNNLNAEGELKNVHFSGRSKTIHNAKVTGYDKKAIEYCFNFSCNIAITNEINLTRLNITFYKEGYKLDGVQEKKYNDLNYGFTSDTFVVRKGEMYLLICLQTDREMIDSEFENYCINNILNNIV